MLHRLAPQSNTLAAKKNVPRRFVRCQGKSARPATVETGTDGRPSRTGLERPNIMERHEISEEAILVANRISLNMYLIQWLGLDGSPGRNITRSPLWFLAVRERLGLQSISGTLSSVVVRGGFW